MLEGNNLLRSLRSEEREALAPFVQTVTCETGHVIYHPGDDISHCYLPIDEAVGSFHVLIESGESIETTMVGREGALGGIVSHGSLPAFARSCIMHGGNFYRISTDDLERAKERSRTIEFLFARYADCLLAQIFQSVACNATHTVEARAAKWLCAAVERTGSHDVTMSQEQLGSIMGVGRSYVSRVVQKFKAANLLNTRRGGVKVLDYDGLLARACACNEQVKKHFDVVLGGVYPALRTQP